MPKYVAFLRAINVGGHLVKMDHLRSLFEKQGYSNVETFIASGNVIFDSKGSNRNLMESKISAFLQKNLGYPVVSFVRSCPEVATIAAFEAFPVSKVKSAHALYVGFVANEIADVGWERLQTIAGNLDEFRVNGTEVYWLSKVKMSESKVSMALIEKTIGEPATFRNMNTIQRLASKYGS